jgi:CheY-like chemotaxis protein
MPKILVVDDEKVLVKGIKFNWKTKGTSVEVGYDGRRLSIWPGKARST